MRLVPQSKFDLAMFVPRVKVVAALVVSSLVVVIAMVPCHWFLSLPILSKDIALAPIKKKT